MGFGFGCSTSEALMVGGVREAEAEQRQRSRRRKPSKEAERVDRATLMETRSWRCRSLAMS